MAKKAKKEFDGIFMELDRVFLPEQEKFLVTDNVPPRFLHEFELMNFRVDYYPDLDNDELSQIIHLYSGIVMSSHILLDKQMLSKADDLKYILRPGSGLDNLDVAYAEDHNILVLNSPEANKDAVGEHAIGLLLSMLNHIPRSFEQVKRHKWLREQNKGIEIKGKTIGIIGYGNTGEAFATKIQGFQSEVLAYDKYKKNFSSNIAREATLEEIYEKANIITIHVPLNHETYHFADDVFIEKINRPFYLINTSRGKVVDTEALLRGIKSGKILGAALDVLENEKLSTYTEEEEELFDKLIKTKKVIITPHIAGWTKEAREKIFFYVLDKFKEHLRLTENSDRFME